MKFDSFLISREQNESILGGSWSENKIIKLPENIMGE